MSRCQDHTLSVHNIVEVQIMAEELLEHLNSIQYVLSEEEQRGLYSIIRNLEFETWQSSQAEEIRQNLQRQRLSNLLKDIDSTKFKSKNTNTEPDMALLKKFLSGTEEKSNVDQE